MPQNHFFINPNFSFLLIIGGTDGLDVKYRPLDTDEYFDLYKIIPN